VFRGDANLRIPNEIPIGLPLGSPEADQAEVQSMREHVLGKKGTQTSRFLSFTERLGIARAFAGTPGPYVGKVEMKTLRALEAAGKIRIWTPESVRDHLKSGAEDKKSQKAANDVYSPMKANAEILIEGQIDP
jgi:hypothetical protein